MGFDSKNESIQGRFYRINKKIEKRITAKYHKIKDWVMDPKGYFLIAVDKKNNLLREKKTGSRAGFPLRIKIRLSRSPFLHVLQHPILRIPLLL